MQSAIPISAIVSELLASVESEDASFHDPLGRGECTDLIHRHAVEERRAVLDRFGISPGAVEAELRRRVSPRWLYFSGILHALDELEEE